MRLCGKCGEILGNADRKIPVRTDFEREWFGLREMGRGLIQAATLGQLTVGGSSGGGTKYIYML